MILHIVLLKYQSDITKAQKSDIYTRLGAMCEAMDGVSQFSAGPSNSPEGHEKGLKDGFTLYFDHEEARQNYLEDATHRAIGGDLVAMLEGGVDGLLVFDLEV